MAKHTNKPILTGYDLVKGYVTDKSANSILSEMTPWQMVSKKDKDKAWVQWNADYFESLGIRQVRNKYNRIIKNRKVAAGILDMSDYTIDSGEFSEMIGSIIPEEECDPLKQFYPIAPPIINVLKGEFIKRDKAVFVSCVDKFTKQEKFAEKERLLNEIVVNTAMLQKQQALQELGLTPDNEQNMQRYQQEMDSTKQTMDASRKFRTYKHVMEEWGQHVLNVEMERFKMDELETEAFEESLTNSVEYWHLDLLENDYRVEFLDTKDCFRHMSPNLKYIEDGDYFGWFEDLTVGDIVNKHGKRLSEKNFKELANILVEYVNYANGAILLTDDQKTMHRPFYDSSKPYPLGNTNIPMNEARVEEYLDDFVKNNFKNAGSVDDIVNYYGRKSSAEGNPKIFKVMRCYFKSQRKIGWLTKVAKDGTMIPGTWIDETYKIIDKPKYDTSIDKRKTKDNLIFGEHIDWEWVNEWRHVIKINANDVHPFWSNSSYVGGYDPIYLDGDRVRFQFKGKDDPYSCSPPVVGCEFRKKGLRPVSLIDLVKPGQVIHNICMNKVPKTILEDRGIQLALNKQTVARNNFGNKAGADPFDYLLDTMHNNKIIDINVDKDLIQTIGNAGMLTPQVLNLSTLGEANNYLNLARIIKEDVYEVVGITRQRLGQQKAYETAAGVQAGISYSESQTEIYYNQHSNELMPRLYQKMIEAAQYYSTINQDTSLYYRNTMEQNEMLKIENMNSLLRDYNIYCSNKPSQKAIQQQLKQLFLQDNTLDASAVDRAEVLLSKSNPEILAKLRDAQTRREEKEQKQYEDQQRMEQERIQSQEKMAREAIENENAQNQLDRESNESIAMTRALGGLQSDNNEDGIIDAQQNLEKLSIERQKINNQKDFNDKKIQVEKDKQREQGMQKNIDNTTKIAIANKKLAGDLVNKNKYDDPKLNKKVADKNNIDEKSK